MGCATLLSTLPSLLPRSASVQGVLTGLLLLLAVGAVRVARRALGSGTDAAATAAAPVLLRRAVLGGMTLGVVLACLQTRSLMDARAAALAMPPLPAGYWLLAAVWAAAVVGTGLLLALLAVRAAGAVHRSATRRLAAVLLVGATTVSASSATDAGLLDGLRKDLVGHPLLLESPLGATRVLVRAGEATSPEGGADLAVRRLVDDGGLTHRAVVVVLPTGSGWVNDHAVTAIERSLRGDVALVSAQAGDLPSWFYFLFDQEPAARSATTLLEGVLREVGRLPAHQRPDVYVVGESLGALVGQSAVSALVDASQVCGVLWSGVPGSASSGHPRERRLLNVDDPVVHLSARTAYRRPADWPGAWVPLLSYGTTWLDTGASLLPQDGHGHRYGAEQDWSLPSC